MKRTVLVLVFLLIAGAATGYWYFVMRDNSSPSVALSVTTTSTTLAPTTVPAAGPYADLASSLPQGLDGYRIDTGAKATGELDMNAAVAAETDQQSERALLETRHYKAGYARAFTNGTNHVYMLVYRFGDATDASLYLKDGFINLYGKGASEYDVTSIPGAQGFSQSTNVEGLPAVVHGVGFTRDNRFFLVFTRSASSDASNSPVVAEQLAKDLNTRVDLTVTSQPVKE